jgi:hypothetical protein
MEKKNPFYLPWLRQPARLPRAGSPIPPVTAKVVDGIEQPVPKAEKQKAKRILPPRFREVGKPGDAFIIPGGSKP